MSEEQKQPFGKNFKDDKKGRDDSPHKIEFASISGNVMGYLDGQYTRPIHPAFVFLKIHIIDDKQEHKVYNPLDKKDLEHLSKDHPDIYAAVLQNVKSFEAQNVESEDATFYFKQVPVGWWCYIVAAYVEKKQVDITQEYGNNGLGKNDRIEGTTLLKNPNLEGIIVPVYDQWAKKIFPGRCKGDPKTNPLTVPPGVPTK